MTIGVAARPEKSRRQLRPGTSFGVGSIGRDPLVGSHRTPIPTLRYSGQLAGSR
jgi:hypothetical protein